MEKENLKRIFEFLEEKEEHNPPFLWKWKNNIPLIEEDLNVKGDLNLAYSKIRSFPEGLKVAGGLNVAYSTILSLPKGLEVGGDLYIHGTPLTKYTKQQLREMIKPGFIKGRIYTGYE